MASRRQPLTILVTLASDSQQNADAMAPAPFVHVPLRWIGDMVPTEEPHPTGNPDWISK
jgi:hypothetical protein